MGLHYIAAARDEIMFCCNGRCTASEQNLQRCPLFLPSSGESMVRASVALVLCTTRLVTRVEACALRLSGVKSLPCELLTPLTLLPPSSGVRCSVAPVLCTTRLVTRGPAGVGESPRRARCGACRSAVKSLPCERKNPLTSFHVPSFYPLLHCFVSQKATALLSSAALAVAAAAVSAAEHQPPFISPCTRTVHLIPPYNQSYNQYRGIHAFLSIGEVMCAYWQVLDFMVCISMYCGLYCVLYSGLY